jgi:hypothetical protein
VHSRHQMPPKDPAVGRPLKPDPISSGITSGLVELAADGAMPLGLGAPDAEHEEHQVDCEDRGSSDQEPLMPELDTQADGEQTCKCSNAVADKTGELVPLIVRLGEQPEATHSEEEQHEDVPGQNWLPPRDTVRILAGNLAAVRRFGAGTGTWPLSTTREPNLMPVLGLWITSDREGSGTLSPCRRAGRATAGGCAVNQLVLFTEGP